MKKSEKIENFSSKDFYKRRKALTRNGPTTNQSTTINHFYEFSHYSRFFLSFFYFRVLYHFSFPCKNTAIPPSLFYFFQFIYFYIFT